MTCTRKASAGELATGAVGVGEGIDDLWKAINDHRAFLTERGLLEKRRARRLADELRHVVGQHVEQRAYERCQGPDFDRLQLLNLEIQLDRGRARESLAVLDKSAPSDPQPP